MTLDLTNSNGNCTWKPPVLTNYAQLAVGYCRLLYGTLQRSDRGILFDVCTGTGIPQGKPGIESVAVRLDVPVDVL